MKYWITGLCAVWLASSQLQAAEVSAKIVGGEDASRSYPWMAGLHSYNPDTNQYVVFPFCGGSLIAPGWVLTAAHCLDDGSTAEEVLLRINQPDIGPPGSRIQPDYDAVALALHNSFTDVSSGFDIALVQLSGKLAFDTVSLADAASMAELDALSRDNDAVSAMGWGTYDTASFDPANADSADQPETLQVLILDYLRRALIPGSKPANVVGAWEPDPDSSSQPFGADTCFGDSGGPLFVPLASAEVTQADNYDVLVGLTSYGSGDCNSEDQPGVYTQVSAYTGWIEQQTSGLGDPLADLAVSVSAATRDLVPGSTNEFVLLVENRSAINSLTDFSLRLEGASNLSLATSVDSTLSCSNSGALILNCNDTGTLLAGNSISYRFDVTDTDGGARSTEVSALITAQDKDDYRVSNNSSVWDIRFTNSPDVEVDLDGFNASQASFELNVSNTSDLHAATGVSVTLTASLPLDFTDAAPCIADSDTSVTCTLGDLAPSAIFSRTIALPRKVGEMLSYDLSASISQTSSDSDPSNNSDSRLGFEVAAKAAKKSGGGTAAALVAVLLLLVRRRRR